MYCQGRNLVWKYSVSSYLGGDRLIGLLPQENPVQVPTDRLIYRCIVRGFLALGTQRPLENEAWVISVCMTLSSWIHLLLFLEDGADDLLSIFGCLRFCDFSFGNFCQHRIGGSWVTNYTSGQLKTLLETCKDLPISPVCHSA